MRILLARSAFRPSYSVMMSPDLRPARSAGEPSDTEATSTPVLSARSRLFAISGLTDWMPTDPPLCEKIAVAAILGESGDPLECLLATGR